LKGSGIKTGSGKNASVFGLPGETSKSNAAGKSLFDLNTTAGKTYVLKGS